MISNVKKELLDKSNYLTNQEKELLNKAISFSEEAHNGQYRATGEPYVIHPYTVCKILMDYNADITTLISALLHDVVEDTGITIQEIDEIFGSNVSTIVNGLTKIEKGTLNKEEYSAINSEKLLTSSTNDIRVAIVKIADRLHNMRTLAVKKVEKKVPYANQTLNFFSPLSERLGLYNLQYELEELAFQYLNPPRYQGVKKLINNYTKLFEKVFQDSVKKINNSYNGAFPIWLDWYQTPIYKSYSLIQEGSPLSELYTIEVITDSTSNCYAVLGLIHNLFKPIQNKFQDNIAIKKSLFSRYLTTMVEIGDIEVKIEIKTEGIKQSKGIFKLLNNNLSQNELQSLSNEFFRDSINSVKSITSNPIEFYDLISFELLQKDITVCTPKMDTVLLPEGATALDFAFYLNSRLAKKMKHVKINGEYKPFNSVLNDMDIVEIIINENDMVKENWLNYAKTSKAVTEINDMLFN